MADEQQPARDPELGAVTDYEKWELAEAAGEAKIAPLETKKPAPAEDAADMPPPKGEAVETPKPVFTPKSDDPDDEELPEAPKPKRGGGFQRKIEAKDREIETLRQQLAEKDGTAKPKHPDDMTLEEQIDARVEERVQIMDAQRQAKAVTQAFQDRCETVRAENDDFDDAFDEANEILQGSNAFVGVNRHVLKSPQGAKLVYWLGTHPKEAKRIAGLDPFEAVAELARIEATKLDPAGEKSRQLPDSATNKTPPRGPKPVSSIANRSEQADEPDPTDFLAWEKWENKRLEKKAAAGR